jgi:hypothetical protein
MLSRLPLDLQREIVNNLVTYQSWRSEKVWDVAPASYSHIFSLLTVSRAFQVETEQLIWRKLSYRTSANEGISSPCTRILSIPRVWLYIKSFHLKNTSSLWTDPPLLKTVKTLARLLEKLSDLIDLELHLGLDSCAPLLMNCSFKLRIFSSDFGVDDSMLLFLSLQPSMTEWNSSNFYPTGRAINFPATTLPHLEVVALPPRHETIIKGRPVTHAYTKNLDSLQILALSAVPLKALFLDSTPGVKGPALTTISELFPDLETFSFLDFYLVTVELQIKDEPSLN